MSNPIGILGGGLAGLAMALDLRKRGHEVVLIEKGSYPRHKVCGEYISLESHRYLLSLCPALQELELPIIKEFVLTSGQKHRFTTPLDLGGFGISRYLLEDLMYQEALKIGVGVKTNTVVKSIEKEGNDFVVKLNQDQNISTRFVVNASGRKSNLRTYPTPKSIYVGVKYHVKIPRDPNQIEIHNFPGGYCGISNIEEGQSCCCYIVHSDYLKKAGDIPSLEAQYLQQNKQLKRIFESAEFLFDQPIIISGIDFRMKKPIENGIYAIGDAAGSVAPVTGNGMSMGLRSAATLAKELDDFLKEKQSKQDLEKNYLKMWKRQYQGRIKRSQTLQKLSETPFLSNRTIELFGAMPWVARQVIKQTHGAPF